MRVRVRVMSSVWPVDAGCASRVTDQEPSAAAVAFHELLLPRLMVIRS